MGETRSVFTEVACDLHRTGLLTRCQEGEVPAWPGRHHGPAMSAKMASLLLSLGPGHVCKDDLLLSLGSGRVRKDGLAPAQPRARQACSSLLLCPAANLSLTVRLPALGSGHQATPTLRLWSARDPTLVSTCGSAAGAPVLSPDSSVCSGLQFLHLNTGSRRGRAGVPGPCSGTCVSM